MFAGNAALEPGVVSPIKVHFRGWIVFGPARVGKSKSAPPYLGRIRALPPGAPASRRLCASSPGRTPNIFSRSQENRGSARMHPMRLNLSDGHGLRRLFSLYWPLRHWVLVTCGGLRSAPLPSFVLSLATTSVDY